MKKISNSQWLYILLAFFTACFILFYPKMLLLLDEYSYFNRGLALSEYAPSLVLEDLSKTEFIDLSGAPYLPGTIILIACFLLLFGNQGVFLMGLFCFIVSLHLVLRILKKLGLHPFGALILFTFPPLLMLSRTVMSGMPSLLCAALFFYILICKKKSGWQYFLMALVAGLGTLFRETNILLFGFFLLSAFWSEKKWIAQLALGFGLAIGARLALSKAIYGSYTYMSAADPFSLQNIPANLPLYALLSVVLIPLGLWQVFAYSGKYKVELKLSLAAFLGLYLIYGYNPIAYSGLPKSLLFAGRFLVPALPLFVIAAAEFLQKKTWLHKSFVQGLFIAGSFACIFVSQYAGHRYNQSHHEISQHLYAKYSDQPIAIDHSGYTSINRYINPLLGLIPQQADLNRFTDSAYVQKVMEKHSKVYALLSMRFENAEKRERAGKYTNILENLKEQYQLTFVEKMETFDGTKVEVWAIIKTSEN